MTELSFAKSFLQVLDTKPTKILPDHVEDPKTYPARSAYILPKMPHPMKKRIKLAPGAERSLSISLKSSRNPPIDLTLSSQPLGTSILNLKEQLSASSYIPVPKLRLLYNKKPLQDSKILKDILGDNETDTKLELGVMVIGGAASIQKPSTTSTPAEDVPMTDADVDASRDGIIGNGAKILKTEEFWTDLKGFLVQRLKDEGEGERVWKRIKDVIGEETEKAGDLD